MKKKKANQPKTISNRRARHDYALDDSLLVGIQLTGREVKALRTGHGHLQGAYVTIKDAPKGGELWLINASISGFPGVSIPEEEQTRTRKLLAKRREIDRLIQEKEQGRTIVPLEILTGGRYIKVRIAAGKGMRKFDKRQALKKRDEERTMRAMVKPW